MTEPAPQLQTQAGINNTILDSTITGDGKVPTPIYIDENANTNKSGKLLKPKKPESDQCPVCDEKVKPSDKGVECEICLTWYHIKCQNVSTKHYECLTDKDCQFHWFCKGCRRGADSLYNQSLHAYGSNS